MVFVVGALTTNILPTNEATFTCSASSYHENITHEMSQYLRNAYLFNVHGAKITHPVTTICTNKTHDTCMHIEQYTVFSLLINGGIILGNGLFII